MTGSAAVVRFSRDRRGYEHFYLIEPGTNRRGKVHARVLYWFRTPPGVKVGRLPLDDEMRRAIEERNPGVSFDWKQILATPIPPPAPDVERWRERRMAERAERAARKVEPDLVPDEPDSVEEPGPEAEGLPPSDDARAEAERPADAATASAGPEGAAPPTGAAQSGDVQAQRPRGRRRRRRGDRGRGPGAGVSGGSGPVSRAPAAAPPREERVPRADDPEGE
jgi:hypothetical protein